MGANDRSHCVLISLPLCFGIAPSVFLFFSLSVFGMKHETKNETSGYYVS